MEQVLTRASAQTLWSLGGVALVLYVAGVVLYRLYLSPIARFPGPKLAAATLWYEFYYDYVLNGQYIFKIKELHRQYGQFIHPQSQWVVSLMPNLEVQSSASTPMS